MVFLRFESVRARLLALMVLILVPIALISIILATTTYRSVNRSIEVSQIEIGSNYAVRVRVWFRGILRTLVAASAALQSDAEDGAGDEAKCSQLAENIRVSTFGIHAINVRHANGVVCSASGMPHLDGDVLASLLSKHAQQPKTSLWGGADLGETRYDVVSIGPHRHLSVYVRTSARTEAIMLLDPALLDAAFDIGRFESGGIVALVGRGQAVVVSRGAPEPDQSWLPVDERFGSEIVRNTGMDRSGRTHAFVSQLVAEPDLYILARFDNSAANAAFTQFLVLSLTPLLMLAVLFIGYVWAIEGNVLRWLKVIDLAARARREGRREQVALAGAMPSDVKLLATSFNEMVADADEREAALRSAFEANQFLMRELHHRVKNSLQVIQSYLALSRRQYQRTSDRHLIETEAKVQVLSTAYRLALLEGMMRPVPLAAFAREIVGNLATSLQRKDQWIDVQIVTEAGLIVDRTIPIGLALVEAVAAGLAAEGSHVVKVDIRETEDGHLDMTVSSDGKVEGTSPPPKIMAGLALQIGATVLPLQSDHILRWRFTA